MESLNFFRGLGSVARRFGLEEAALLDSMVFWWRTNKANNRNFRDGRWWTFNSVKALAEIFPWWSEKQVRRILANCVEQGALIEGAYNTEPRDRTKWYSPGDELLALYGEAETGNCICPNGQMDLPERAKSSAQMGKPLPCKYHEVQHDNPPKAPQGAACAKQPKKRNSREWKATADWKSERFEAFWKAYPCGRDRQKAIRAWDKLRPDDDLVHQMALGLKRALAREDWQRGIGIPYASTWINGRRWEDEDKPLPAAAHAPTPPPAPRPYHLEMIDGEEVVVYDG